MKALDQDHEAVLNLHTAFEDDDAPLTIYDVDTQTEKQTMTALDGDCEAVLVCC